MFAAQAADLTIPAQQFVTNLYEGFLQRGPDASGLSFWTTQAGTTAAARQAVLSSFATCPPARELAGALYREAFWLVTDHLGTPRMVVDKSGSLAGIKRHDYLPFGEEIGAGVGGRATGRGYSAVDNVRQKFTGYESDAETGLDYAQARQLSNAQGRFVSPDPLLSSAKTGQPQSWNRYTYCLNNPLFYTDPTGLVWAYIDSADGTTRSFKWYDNEKDIESGYTLFTSHYYSKGSGQNQSVYLGNGPKDWKYISSEEYEHGVFHEIAEDINARYQASRENFARQEEERFYSGWGGLLLGMEPSHAGSMHDPMLDERDAEDDQEEFISIYHGSINDSSRIRRNGLDPNRTPTWVTRDRNAAEDAIRSPFRVDHIRDPGIIESRIPLTDFNRVFFPSERPYGEFGGRINSSEIPLRSPNQIFLFNKHIVR